MVRALRDASQSGELSAPKQLTVLLDLLMTKDWVVYAKATLKKAQTVVRYLSRYTYKTAISNSRILDMDDHCVQFRWKDYRDGQQKIMMLSGEEFVRRYLLHILPKGFMRIRHFGFLANRCRARKLNCIRDRIKTAEKPEVQQPAVAPAISASTNEPCHCPVCRIGVLRVRCEVSPKRKQELRTN